MEYIKSSLRHHNPSSSEWASQSAFADPKAIPFSSSMSHKKIIWKAGLWEGKSEGKENYQLDSIKIIVLLT